MGSNLSAMKKKYTKINNLSISNDLLDFINNELLKDTKVSPEKFWFGFDKAVHELAPRNKELLQIRDDLQKKIDNWHIKNNNFFLFTLEFKSIVSHLYLK